MQTLIVSKVLHLRWMVYHTFINSYCVFFRVVAIFGKAYFKFLKKVHYILEKIFGGTKIKKLLKVVHLFSRSFSSDTHREKTSE